MIRDASIMDRPVRRRRVTPRLAALLAAVALVVVVAVLAWPRMSGWFGSQASVDVSRLRIAEVVRGDLVRDVSVQGRVVAAWHPTLFSPADGTVRLQARAGDVVEAGDVVAVVESPELGSRLRQERSTLASLEADLERQRIEGRQDELADRQAIDLARVELDAAERAMARAERSRTEGILNEVEYEEAVDDLSRARLVLEHAIHDAGLRGETAAFELRQAELGVERQRLVARSGERLERLDAIHAAIRERIDHLTAFLEGYARLARLPQPHVRSVDWEGWLAGPRRLYRFEIARRLPSAPGVFDPTQLEQVLINLLKNAHEASDDGGAVEVRVGMPADGSARIEVLDRGRGMEPDVMRRALLPFYSTKPSGGGVGLPLCREIVEAHGGTLRIQGRPGGGTAVTIRLPPAGS